MQPYMGILSAVYEAGVNLAPQQPSQASLRHQLFSVSSDGLIASGRPGAASDNHVSHRTQRLLLQLLELEIAALGAPL